MRNTRTFARFTTTFSTAAGADEPSSVVLKTSEFGVTIPLPTHAALTLDDPNSLVIVMSGELDLFFVRIGEDGTKGARRYVATLRAGEVVPCPGSSATSAEGMLVAVGFGEASVQMAPLTALDDDTPAGSRLARALASGVAESIGRGMYRASRGPSRPVEVTWEPLSLKQGASITAGSDTVWLWVDEGEMMLGDDVPVDGPNCYVPLARGMWLTVSSPVAHCSVGDTHTAVSSGTGRVSLLRAGARFLGWVSKRFAIEDASERVRLARKVELEVERHTRTLTSLTGLLRKEPAVAGADEAGDALLDACSAVYKAARIKLRAPHAHDGSTPDAVALAHATDPVAAISDASGVRQRRVALITNWWQLDCGPLLGFIADSHSPVALISSPRGGYTMYDPVTGRTTPLTESLVAKLEPFAYMFYRPAPNGPLTLGGLGKMVLADIGSDLRRVAILVLAGAGLGLALPMVTGKMFNDVIPSAQVGNAITLFTALVATALGAALFDVARALALVRVEGRSNAVLQSAMVDRLLSLPAQFFRQYSVGDLSMRADSVNAARQMLTGAAITSLLGGALTVISLGLMWWYSAKLAAVAIGVLIIGAIVTGLVGFYALPFERRRQALAGKISSMVFELLGGISKLHVAAAEPRLFSEWAVKFRELKSVSYRAALGAAVLAVFNDVLPIVASGAVFIIAVKLFAVPPPDALSTGDFIAFNAAFGAALAAGTGVSNTLVSLLNIIPLMERAKPILSASPEADDARPDAGPITGRLDLAHVSFGYVPGAPPILDDVTLEIRPGEYVAFVGPSGAGKSTILRLMLGFEKPDRGAIYYDGKDLGSIDVSAIRRQCAVVLQQSRLLAGDIFTNIVGASPLTLDDAWHAAELAGLADDIRDMPMGMHTVVSEGGSTLSGGQRQRLLIARALVRSPRIVFFDEATSALDNRSQEVVTRSLESMQASRVVIAHRLTTVQRADRIFVLSGGKIVQNGRYEDLIGQPGLFQQLAQRQLV